MSPKLFPDSNLLKCITQCSLLLLNPSITSNKTIKTEKAVSIRKYKSSIKFNDNLNMHKTTRRMTKRIQLNRKPNLVITQVT